MSYYSYEYNENVTITLIEYFLKVFEEHWLEKKPKTSEKKLTFETHNRKRF